MVESVVSGVSCVYLCYGHLCWWQRSQTAESMFCYIFDLILPDWLGSLGILCWLEQWHDTMDSYTEWVWVWGSCTYKLFVICEERFLEFKIIQFYPCLSVNETKWKKGEQSEGRWVTQQSSDHSIFKSINTRDIVNECHWIQFDRLVITELSIFQWKLSDVSRWLGFITDLSV